MMFPSSFFAFTLLSLLSPPAVWSFTTTTTTTATRRPTTTTRSLSIEEIPDSANFARAECWFWFFGAAGSAGIARAGFPAQFQRYLAAQQLKGVGPTKGGPTVGLPAQLLGYPEDVCLADVKQIVDNPMTIEQMVAKYPEPEDGDYMAAKRGYINIRTFNQANAKANPLALQVVFESFSRSQDNVRPMDAQEVLDLYKASDDGKLQNELKIRLFVGKGLIWAAGTVLLVLLGIADIFTFSDLYKGWFPDWPGGTNFPFSIFTEEHGSLFEIPNYWI